MYDESAPVRVTMNVPAWFRFPLKTEKTEFMESKAKVVKVLTDVPRAIVAEYVKSPHALNPVFVV